MPIFKLDFHSGHKVPLIETDDISNKAITVAKLGDDIVSWIQRLVRDSVISLIGSLDEISAALTSFAERLGSAEQAIEELRSNPSCDCPHIIQLTQAEYDALEDYERGAIYFIIEPEYWHFGDTFPVILGGYGESLGEPLPILLN